MRFFLFAIVFISLIAALPGCTSSPEGKDESPNIVLIVADDLGYNDVSFYRDMHASDVPKPPTCETPNIDQLAREGVAFTDFYAGAAVCSPSRAALLSGRNKTRVGIYNWIPEGSPMHFRDEEMTIAEVLKQKNYHTAHFGKWHLTSDFETQPGPLDQGYDYGFYTQNNAEPSHENPVNFIRNEEPVGPLNGYSSHLVVGEAIEWLDSREEQEKPFYMNVWFHEPHVVCAAPEKFTSRHSYRQDYYGSIENMDAAIAKLMNYLKENGLDDNTLVMFSSDNGSQENYSNLPFIGEKCLNLEGGLKVPFIARWKNRIPAGKISTATGSFTDVLPTLAAITGAEMPDDRTIDGESLAAVFENPEKEFTRDNPIFFYRYFHDPICVLRDGDWLLNGYDELYEYSYDVDITELAKFKPAEGEPSWSQWSFQEEHMEAILDQEPNYWRLYNVKDDPSQTNDLSDRHQEKLEEMKKKTLKLRKEMVEEGGNWFESGE